MEHTKASDEREREEGRSEPTGGSIEVQRADGSESGNGIAWMDGRSGW
jgi:hypothetical protein